MKSNIKVVYQKQGKCLVAITYEGNDILHTVEYESYEFYYLPDNIKYSFGIEDDNNE